MAFARQQSPGPAGEDHYRQEYRCRAEGSLHARAGFHQGTREGRGAFADRDGRAVSFLLLSLASIGGERAERRLIKGNGSQRLTPGRGSGGASYWLLQGW